MATGDMSALFSGLSVEDGGTVGQVRTSSLDGTPVRDWVKDSRSKRDATSATGDGSIKTIGPVPEDSVDTLKNLIVRAAAEAKHGVRFGKPVAVKGQRGKVSFSFQTKDKKNIDMSAEAVAARKATRAANKAAKAKTTK